MPAVNGSQDQKRVIKARSTGTIAALDKAAGEITLDHQAIPDAQWPAMTMKFGADPSILKGAQLGDKVAFDVEITSSGGKVTSITRQ